MNNKEELKIMKKFNLEQDVCIFLEKFQCLYHGGKVPIVGKLFIFNDRIGFRSVLSTTTIIGKKTTKMILISDVVLCESDPSKAVGNCLLLTMNNGSIEKFTGLGNGLERAYMLI